MTPGPPAGPVVPDGGGGAIRWGAERCGVFAASAAVAARASSPQLPYRCAGTFASARAITGSNAASAGCVADGRGGGSYRWACMAAAGERRANGTAPVSIS